MASLENSLIERISSYPAKATNRRIAGELGVSSSTVHKYRGGNRRPRRSPKNKRLVHLDKRYERVVFVSDLHVPFHSEQAWDCFIGLVQHYSPHLIILGGDLFDCYSISRHDKDPTRASQIQDEFDVGGRLWNELEEVSPKSEKKVIWGNHEERINALKRSNPGLMKLRALEIENAAEMPKKWECYPNQSRLKLGPLSFLHGDIKSGPKGGVYVAHKFLGKLRTSVVFGHHHRFQSHFETQADGDVRAAFSTGHMCESPDIDYITEPDWQQGFMSFEFKWPDGVFSAHQHIIVNGKLVYDGKIL